MLCSNRKLAMTSSTPGKTKVVNHFLINDSWYLVDLPGYGFANVGKKGREAIASLYDDKIPITYCSAFRAIIIPPLHIVLLSIHHYKLS